MSLDKAIKSGKEHRKPWYGRRAIDPCCRSHGGCPGCEQVRKTKSVRAQLSAEEQERELGEK